MAIGHSVTIMDPDGIIIDANPATQKLTGLDISEIIGKKCYEIFHSSNKEPFGCPRLKMIKSGTLEVSDMEIEVAGGMYLVSCTPVFEDNKLSKIIHIATNITDKKKAEEALRGSEKKYRAIVEGQTEFITRFLPDTTHTFANDALCNYFGVNNKDLIGKKISDMKLGPVVPEDDMRKLEEHFASFDLTNQIKSIEHRFVFPDGNVRWVEWTDKAIFDESGKITEFQSVGKDITEKRKAEEALKESEEKFRSYVENAPDGVFVADQNGCYLEVNDAACKMTGYSRVELLRMKILDLVPPEGVKYAKEHFGKVVKTGSASGSSPYLTKEGEIRYWIVEAVKLSEDRFLGFTKDITDMKKSEEKICETQKLYETIAENLPNGIVHIFDKNFRYLYNYGPELSRVGLTNEMLIGKSIHDILPPEAAKLVESKYKLVLKGESVSFEGCYGGVTFLVNAVPLKNMKGEVDRILVLSINISEKKKAEEALKEQYDGFITILNAFPEILYVVDPKTYEVIFVNKKFKDILGKDPLGNKCYAEFQGFDKPCDFCTNEIILKTRKPYTWEHPNPLLNKYYLITDQIIKWPDGGDVRLELAIDISHRKEMEAEIELLYHAIEQSPAIVVITDKEGLIEFVNPKFIEVTGYTLPEIKGKNPRILKTGLLPEGYFEELWKSITTGKTWAGEFLNRKKNGTMYWESASIAPVKTSGGEITHFVKVAEDITYKKLAEEDLKERENTLRGIFSSAPIGINLFKNRIWMWSNKGMEEITGYQIDELVGKSPRFLYESDEEYERIEKVLYKIPRDAEIIEVETKFVRKDGDTKNVNVRNSLLDSNDPSKGHITVVLDITERKKSEKQLGKNLEYFAHLVDHIRNPMAIMSGFIQVDIENEKTKERLLRQIDRIEELIKQLDQGWMDTEDTRKFLKRYMK